MDPRTKAPVPPERAADGAPRSPCIPGARGLWFLVGWLLALAALEAHGRAVLPDPAPANVAAASIPDPARAAPRDLRRIPGIGPLLALEIQRVRWEEGGLDELERVPGIGPLLSESIGSWLAAQGAEVQPSTRGRVPAGE